MPSCTQKLSTKTRFKMMIKYGTVGGLTTWNLWAPTVFCLHRGISWPFRCYRKSIVHELAGLHDLAIMIEKNKPHNARRHLLLKSCLPSTSRFSGAPNPATARLGRRPTGYARRPYQISRRNLSLDWSSAQILKTPRTSLHSRTHRPPCTDNDPLPWWLYNVGHSRLPWTGAFPTLLGI